MAPQAVHMFPTLPYTSQPRCSWKKRARKEELLIKDEREVEMEASNSFLALSVMGSAFESKGMKSKSPGFSLLHLCSSGFYTGFLRPIVQQRAYSCFIWCVCYKARSLAPAPCASVNNAVLGADTKFFIRFCRSV